MRKYLVVFDAFSLCVNHIITFVIGMFGYYGMQKSIDRAI